MSEQQSAIRRKITVYSSEPSRGATGTTGFGAVASSWGWLLGGIFLWAVPILGPVLGSICLFRFLSLCIIDRGILKWTGIVIGGPMILLFAAGLYSAIMARHEPLEMDLVVIEDTEAINHWSAPAGPMEIPMFIGAGTIVGGSKDDLGKSGTCTVRWIDGEKIDALGSKDEVIEQFLDLPCANLAVVTDTDRAKRVPFNRLVPGASRPDADPYGLDRYGSVAEIARKMSGLTDGGRVMILGPVWACASPKEYQEKLGSPDAKCLVLYDMPEEALVNRKADAHSKFYRVTVPLEKSTATYVVHSHDVIFAPMDKSRFSRHRECRTTPQATCVSYESSAP